MEKKKIALIEDDFDLNNYYKTIIEEEGYFCKNYFDGETFLNESRELLNDFNLIISDYLLPGKNGLEVFSILNNEGINIPFLIITGINDIELAVKAIKSGISDFILKPVDKEILFKKIRTYINTEDYSFLKNLGEIKKDIIIESEESKRILERLYRLSKAKINVLFYGESGVGKEVFAKVLHNLSEFKKGPFVPLNLSAIPDTLFESEFFGYKKGSFTGAERDYTGMAKSADGGTLFLDEVGDLSLFSQAKLLRFLEDFLVQPIGSTEKFKVNLRIISATNKNLKKEVEEKKFREDLFYRISQISIEIPPLRERKEDIIPLAKHFIKEISKNEGLENIVLTPAAADKLLKYSWPGNIRELKSKITEAIFNSPNGIIEPQHILLEEKRESKELFFNYEKAKRDFEKKYLTSLLKTTGGNVKDASNISGLTRNAIYEMAQRNGIDIDTFRK